MRKADSKEITKMFLGFMNITDDLVSRKEFILEFVAKLIVAGFPQDKINSVLTGVWIETSGTKLIVVTNYAQGVTTTELTYQELVLAKSTRRALTLFGGLDIVYSVHPDAIDQLPKQVELDVTPADDHAGVSIAMK